MLLTISPYEPDNVFDTLNLSFRIDSIEVKNKAIAWTFWEVFTDFFSYTWNLWLVASISSSPLPPSSGVLILNSKNSLPIIGNLLAAPIES